MAEVDCGGVTGDSIRVTTSSNTSGNYLKLRKLFVFGTELWTCDNISVQDMTATVGETAEIQTFSAMTSSCGAAMLSLSGSNSWISLHHDATTDLVTITVAPTDNAEAGHHSLTLTTTYPSAPLAPAVT